MDSVTRIKHLVGELLMDLCGFIIFSVPSLNNSLKVGFVLLMAYSGWIHDPTVKLGRQFWSIRKVAKLLDFIAIQFNQSFFWAVEMIIL